MIKNIYLILISLLFFSIEMTATPMHTANPKTETTTHEKPTFKERIAHKFLKKRLKKIKKHDNKATYILANTTFGFGILSILSLLFALVESSYVGIIALLLSPAAGIVGVILGIITLILMQRNPGQNERKPLAIIGLILSLIALLAFLIVILNAGIL